MRVFPQSTSQGGNDNQKWVDNQKSTSESGIKNHNRADNHQNVICPMLLGSEKSILFKPQVKVASRITIWFQNFIGQVLIRRDKSILFRHHVLRAVTITTCYSTSLLKLGQSAQTVLIALNKNCYAAQNWLNLQGAVLNAQT